MKKIMTIALALIIAVGSAGAAKKKAPEKKNTNKPVFTTIKEIPITSVKDQNRSGTCWDYSTLSFFEAEILKNTGKTYDLCESFVCNKTYMERAIQVVRFHGDCQFAQGGSAEDVLATMKTHGIVPEGTMPFPGSLYGDSLNNFNEFFKLLEPYVAAVAKSDAKKISSQWKVGLQGILDAYLGKCPESFTYEGKRYTPKSFMASLGIDLNDYVGITSYTHHPFYTTFAVEVQDNWRFPQSYNVPMDEMMQIIDNAIEQGYTVAWGGDVSEDGFTRKGLAYAIDAKKTTQNLQGSDMAKWLKMTTTKKRDIIDSLGVSVPEIVPTQQMRQERFDNWELTDDHCMHIFGVAKDQIGKEYYMVKNSWGETGDYKGIWYMSRDYMTLNTTYLFLNRHALSKSLRKALTQHRV